MAKGVLAMMIYVIRKMAGHTALGPLKPSGVAVPWALHDSGEEVHELPIHLQV